MKRSIFRKILAVTVLCMLLVCSLVPAFATVAYVQGDGWFWGNGTNKLGKNMTAGNFKEGLYLGGMAQLKTSAAVSQRTVSVVVSMYHIDDHSLAISSAIKTNPVASSGATSSGRITFVQTNKTLKYTKGESYYYESYSTNFTNTMSGYYWGYITNQTKVSASEVA